ncbi:uncharacterized protein LOC119878727 isoform X2 [Canis lupus familiaris]|uniref:uncharacterized protein LOC119878727 isoform X2 n=1 Tax=Canis lupus familiaris TaxID=9615 RepID=UPI0018F3D5B5|nr:uncharacterized protein LOC119878727 isoform X2 [Canis lupus familiaris]
MTPRTELTAPQGSGLVRGQRVTAAMRRDRVHRTIPVMTPALLWISMHCSFLQEGRNPGPVRNLHLLHPGHLAGLLSGGFHQPPEFLSLRKLLAFMGLNTPGSDLENRAQRYLELVELDDEDEEDWGGRAGDRMGHTDPASMQLGREHRLRTPSNTLNHLRSPPQL